ncbi:MAG: LTA synthase family protein [Tannerella sp.]|jgi:phosphoglycerol transferase MdoB-like AlkP superfamily enzyme|nr:LTA synthase family protein [Tannerella sp.]
MVRVIAWFGGVTEFFFPDRKNRSLFLLFFLLILFKILWFDYSWCSISTFRPFSEAETYIFGILLALALTLPVVVSRAVWPMWVIDVLLGMALLSNLIYFRTYYTAIPLSSYNLIGNMADFTSSISGSAEVGDVMFALSTVVWALYYLKRRKKYTAGAPGRLARYAALTGIFVVAAVLITSVKGGFKKAYESLQDSYTHTCGTPMYTVFGSLYYDYVRDREIYTPQTGARILDWIKRHPSNMTQPEDTRTNCIIILAESLESWVLERTVEGRELTPCLNRLLREASTFYAPHVLSQVKGGRSIDAQLMINAGLLPIDNGVYSLKYPHSYYPSLAKAMKEKYGEAAHSFVLTADKPPVWNQAVIAAAFGYDRLVSKADFDLDEKVGPHYRRQLGDASLLRQCAAKIVGGQTWADGANLLQIVTYSGHFPFVLPRNLGKVSFSPEIPATLRDYMTVANYTDSALGEFVETIRHTPDFRNTMIVITGDHEGLVGMRSGLRNTEKIRDMVSEAPFVPFIIVNMPEVILAGRGEDRTGCLRYDGVMGQIDIYPTLMYLMGLTDYEWKGLGINVFGGQKKNISVDPHNRLYGDASGATEEYVRHIGDAWGVSDEIIKYDYFRNSTDFFSDSIAFSR